MAMDVKVGTFTKNTATGNQSITGIGFIPKVVIFFLGKNTATGFRTDFSQSIGWGVSSTERTAHTAFGPGGDTTGKTLGASSNIRCILIGEGTLKPLVYSDEADLVSMDADGFTINWVTNGGTAEIIGFLALGGADLTNVKAGNFFANTSTGNQSITGIGFQPDLCLFTTEAKSTSYPAGQGKGFNFGAAISSTSRFALGIAGGRPGKAGEGGGYLTNVRCLLGIKKGTQLEYEWDFVSQDTDGFTVNLLLTKGSAIPVEYLCLKTTNGEVNIKEILSPTSTGTQATTGVGFKPSAILDFTRSQVSSTVGLNDSSAGVGVSDATTDYMVNATSLDNPGSVSLADTHLSTTKIGTSITPGATPTLDEEADVTSFDTDGFTLDWTTVSATQIAHQILSFGEAGAGATTVSIFKPTTLRVLATSNIFKSTNLRVKVLNNQLSLPSTLKVTVQIQKSLPSTLRVLITQQTSLSSDLKVRVVDNQLSLPTNLRVLLTSQLLLPSQLSVVLGITTEQTFLPTNLRVLVTDSVFLPTVLRVLVTQQTSLLTNLKVRVEGQQTFLPTTLRIVVSNDVFLSTTLRVNATQQIFLSTSLKVRATLSTFLPTSLRVVVFEQIFLPTTLRVKATLSTFLPTTLRVKITDSVFLPTTLRVVVSNSTSLPTTLRVLVTQSISLPSILKIRVEGQQTFLPSTLRVGVFESLFLPTTLRVLATIQKSLPTSIRVKVLANQLVMPSSLRVALVSQISVPTSLRVKVIDNLLLLPSTLHIKVIGQSTFLPTNLRVAITPTVFLSTSLRVLATQQLFLPSSLNVNIPGTIVIPTTLRVNIPLQLIMPTNLRVSIPPLFEIIDDDSDVGIVRKLMAQAGREVIRVHEDDIVPVFYDPNIGEYHIYTDFQDIMDIQHIRDVDDINHSGTNYLEGSIVHDKEGKIDMALNPPSGTSELMITYATRDGLSDEVIQLNIDMAKYYLQGELWRAELNFSGTSTYEIMAKWTLYSIATYWSILGMNSSNAIQSGYNYRIAEFEIQTKLWGEGMIAETLLNKYWERSMQMIKALKLFESNPEPPIYVVNRSNTKTPYNKDPTIFHTMTSMEAVTLHDSYSRYAIILKIYG